MADHRPTQNLPRPTQTQTVSVGDEPIIDMQAAGDFIGFVMRSLGRRKKMVMVTTIVAFILGLLVALLSPKVYRINTRILTHRTVMAQIANPDRGISQNADNPVAGAVEIIKSRENLENLMSDIDLENKWMQKRSALHRFKDRALSQVFKPTKQDVHESFIKLLTEAISASVVTDVVLIDVEWPDPDLAMSIAEGVVSRFMKMRHDMELSEVLSTVSILERTIETSRKSIEEAVGRMQRLFSQKEHQMPGHMPAHAEPRRPRRSRVVAIRRPLAAAHADPAVDDLRRALLEKQGAIASLKHALEGRLKKAQEELNERRATLGPDHPDLQDARRTVDELQRPTPELSALQAEEARLAAQLTAMPQAPAARDQPKTLVKTDDADGSGAEAPADTSGDIMKVAVSEELFEELGKDPEIVSIMAEIAKKQEGHDQLIKRLSNARIESETANVAFEYRYNLVGPPVYPKRAVKPNVPLVIGGGAVVGLVLGALLAVAADVLCRRILESWQVSRLLDVHVLGEIEEL